MNARYKWNGGEWGPHAQRKRTSEQNWRKPIQWNNEAERLGDRRKVFCASLADWLDNKVDQQWREDLAGLIRATPMLDWLLLTKRIENYAKYAPWAEEDIPRNVWLGVTCEDQRAFDRRWEIASNLPATVHFVSYEPAIGPLTITKARVYPRWIICGGESGHGRGS
jgi:protein gp37